MTAGCLVDSNTARHINISVIVPEHTMFGLFSPLHPYHICCPRTVITFPTHALIMCLSPCKLYLFHALNYPDNAAKRTHNHTNAHKRHAHRVPFEKTDRPCHTEAFCHIIHTRPRQKISICNQNAIKTH